MIEKSGININFGQGLDQKTDPKQVQPGKFLSLVNTVFDKGGLLQKRNGYGVLSGLPNTDYSYITTLNDNLTAIGPAISAYSNGSKNWVTKGAYTPLELSTLPLIRNSVNQTQCDSAIASNGLVCTVYTETTGPSTSYKYAVADSTTGQNILSPVAIPVSSGTVSGSPRVFVLGSYFIIIFTNVISSTPHLQYIAVPSNNPSSPTSNVDLASSYAPAPTVSWDAYAVNGILYVAYNTTTGGQSVKVLTLSSQLVVSTPVTFSSQIATMMAVTADVTNPTSPTVWVSYYDVASFTGFTLAVDKNLNTVLAPVETIGSGSNLNLTIAAQNGTCSIFVEASAVYAYDTGVVTNLIARIDINLAGAVSALGPIARSVGLASKAFVISGTIYFLAAYQSPYQSTYFLINGSASLQANPQIVAKLAYENGGGYLPAGLPSISVVDSVAQVAYLYKDLIQAVNKNTNVPSGNQVAGVYTQTGINLAAFSFDSSGIDTAEIGSNLNLGGGFGWSYDGYYPVEQNFFLYPDSIELATDPNAVTWSGTVTSGSNVITALSSMAFVAVGQSVTGTGIPANQTIISVSGSTATFGPLVATSSHTAEVITFTGHVNLAQTYFYQFTYEWQDNQGNQYRSAPSIPVSVTTTGTTSTNSISVPYLRLTYKTPNPVKVVGYRWSTAQQSYYQFTSISQPILNSTSLDSITFYDAYPDTAILGNNLLYTTGGIVENTNPPAYNLTALFDTRQWLVDAEDRNLLWFSKQVIEATPVEWSDQFTFYVAPTTGAQGSTGPITAVSVMDDKLIIFKENAIYYINGVGPDNTGANNQYSQPIFITSTVGCKDQDSIVFMPQGVMFQSNKGIWLLTRSLDTQYIGAPVEDFTRGASVQSAVNVPETNQVRFTLSSGITLMYDYFFGQWGSFKGVPATSSCVYQGLHTFINASGQVYQETPNQYLDGSNPVLISFTTSWFSLAGLQGYERFYDFYILAQYLSPHLLNVQVAYDYNPSVFHQSLIRPGNFSPSTPGPFGIISPFGSPTNLEQWRVHAKQQLCQSFQISISEVFDPAYGTIAGAGFTMSGLHCRVGIKKGARTIRGANTVG